MVRWGLEIGDTVEINWRYGRDAMETQWRCSGDSEMARWFGGWGLDGWMGNPRLEAVGMMLRDRQPSQ